MKLDLTEYDDDMLEIRLHRHKTNVEKWQRFVKDEESEMAQVQLEINKRHSHRNVS